MNIIAPTRRSYPVSPVASFFNLGRELDRLFDTPLTGLGGRDTTALFAPIAEVREDKNAVVVTLELPGVDRKDVDVTFHDGVLSVVGERKAASEAKEEEVLRSERYYGRFERHLTLSQLVDGDKIKATYKDGLLTITVPKSPEAKPKTIDITTA
jgi:HSP20 family protein